MAMKIVQWAKYYPPEWGGMERVTHDLAAGFAAQGMDSAVVAFTNTGVRRSEDWDGVRILRHRSGARLDTQPLSAGWVVDAVREGSGAAAVIAHAPNLLILLPMLALWVGGLFRRNRPRRILFWHSDIVGKGIWGITARPVEWLLASLSDVIVATSPPYAARSPILSRFARRTVIVPLGIDPPEAAAAAEAPPPPLPRDIAAFVGDRPFALSVGRLVPYKGFAPLIDAFARLPASMALVIVGQGPLRDPLRAAIDSADAADRIRLVGSVDHDALTTLYRHCTCLVMASTQRSEAFGMVLVEAMSHARPLVVSNIAGSGVPWVAGDDGAARIIPVGDPAAMAEAIAALLTDPVLAAEMGRTARRRFDAHFTRSAMVRAVTLLLTPKDGSG